ncbi:MAG: ribosome biogenesis factor YjgA [Gammaproteobacteria bacterium]|nr:ribosome biogenesis factor YjgA [Gammaproteobacteria bacterium]
MQEPKDLPPSKSQRKRDMLALQKIGEILVSLSPSQLARIPLESDLADAVNAARNIKSHEGKRRQLQYIGKLMRHLDPAPIEAAIEKIQLKNHLNKSRFHQVERWRDRLIAEGDTLLEEFLQQFPQTETQELRQLVRNAQKEHEANKHGGADTALFRFLRDVIESQ